MIKLLKRAIPVSVKGRILYLLSPGSDPAFAAVKNKKKVVVTLCGFYQNLGDMALTYAQQRFLQDVFPDREIVLLPIAQTYTKLKALKRACGPEDIITVLGGGNLGDIYAQIEDCRQFVISKFPRNPIFSFPQSLAFAGAPKVAKAYARHKNLTLFAREVNSCERMKQLFPKNKARPAPDTVLYLDESEPQRERKEIITCLRCDVESALPDRERARLLEALGRVYPDIRHTDTVDVPLEACRPGTYEQTLRDFWDLLKSAKVVVTDRLHGMIFCAITGTPCVALDNSTGKVKGVYETWLSHVRYIKYIDIFDTARVLKAMEALAQLRPDQTQLFGPTPAFADMKAMLRGETP